MTKLKNILTLNLTIYQYFTPVEQSWVSFVICALCWCDLSLYHLKLPYWWLVVLLDHIPRIHLQ